MDYKFMHPAEQIVLTINRIYRKQMTTTSGGNLSIIDSDGNIWITPSGIDKGALTPADICMVKPDGTVVGKYKPSVELPFHKLVYKTRPEVRAVVHAHSPSLVSYSLIRKIPDTRIIPTARLVCGDVGIAKYEVPGSMELGEAIAAEFKKGADVVVMENHGVVTCGQDLFDAFEKFETLERCAKLDITSKLLGNAYPLTDEQIELANEKGKAQLGEFIPAEISSKEKEIRNKMCTLIHRAYDQDLFSSTMGTFSEKLGNDSFIITPYGKDRKHLEPQDLVRVDNGWREAGKRPSRSAVLHRMIYEAHPEFNAIVVAQPTNILAFGITRTEIDSRTIPESYIKIRDLTRLPYGTNITNPQEVVKKLSADNPVILIENDSVIAVGKTLIEAFDALEVVEFTANTIIHAGLVGEIVKITDKEVDDINKAFNL
ncbi:MAG: class II aldolase/adducin family protein [Clostridia bacterium]|nr:class II aldolase/adducin family protein [Clostridia bacterium]